MHRPLIVIVERLRSSPTSEGKGRGLAGGTQLYNLGWRCTSDRLGCHAAHVRPFETAADHIGNVVDAGALVLTVLKPCITSVGRRAGSRR